MDDDDFEVLKREATTWVVRLNSGAATSADGDAVRAWRARSAEHERAFREVARLWTNLGPALAKEPRQHRSVFTRRSFLAAGGLAASAAGMAFAMSELGLLPSINGFLADHMTAVGERMTVNLPDGSSVTLDGKSALSIGYTAARRQLTLSEGAAVFDVEADPRPFVVIADDGNSRLSEGSLSVTHGAYDVSVECLRGRVKVECSGEMDLAEGEGISYSAKGLGEKVTGQAETAAAWRKGLLIFNHRQLRDVVADLNRHRRGKVMIARSALGLQRVSGVFHLDRPEEILAHLQDTLHVRAIGLVGGAVLLM